MREEVYTVALFGHRDLSAHLSVEKGLYPIIADLIRNKPFVEIYIGRDGEFDVFAASVVKRVQRALGNENSSLSLVLPYPKKDIEFFEKYYDCVIIPDIGKTHPKEAIRVRNRFMVERCDLFVCYVHRDSGGACEALKYAKKLGKEIINLAQAKY